MLWCLVNAYERTDVYAGPHVRLKGKCWAFLRNLPRLFEQARTGRRFRQDRSNSNDDNIVAESKSVFFVNYHTKKYVEIKLRG